MVHPVVQITTSSFGEASETPLRLLERAGCRVRSNPYGRKVTADELRELLADVDGLVAGTEPIDRGTLAAAPKLKVISRVGVGTDAIDLDAVREAGIALYNTPDAHVEAVAQLTLSFLLEGFRRHVESDRAIRQGQWSRPMGRLLSEKTVGFVGFGRVPRRVAELLKGFNLRLLAYDPTWDERSAASCRVERSELSALVETCDALSLHAPGGSGTILGAAELERMKTDIVLVNTARGGLIDEDALEDFLARNKDAFAAMDTFEHEPYSGPLSKLGNTLLTAHLAGYSQESRVAMELEAAQNCLRGLGVTR